MRFARSLVAVAILALPAPRALAVTPIGDLHGNTSNGVPLLLNQSVTVQGTVTVPKGLFQTTNVDIHVQDATGAIVVFRSGLPANALAVGDNIEVTGNITQFSGLTEIGAPVTITDLGAGTEPAPLTLTCNQLSNSYMAGDLEPNEGMLVRLAGVSITGGTWPTAPSGSNVSVTVNDGTGPATIFIDRDTQVDGTPAPPAVFDIVGVLRQFDSTSPYTSGYQLVPRFPTDVTAAGCPGPAFLTLPVAGDVASDAVTITWTTDSPSNSTVEYGTAPGVYSGSTSDPTNTTDHAVTLTGLAPRTLYYFRALSTDGDGTCNSPERKFVTFPVTGTPGAIDVYFTRSVDHAASAGTLAQGEVDVESKLVALIDAAQWSIDATFYYFQLPNVTNALIAAKNRGVAVRAILGVGNSESEAASLSAAGVPFIYSNFGGNHAQGIMHSKYVIVDAKPSGSMNPGRNGRSSANGARLTDPKDAARVWTGSWNCFADAQTEANNTIVFQDYGMAVAFTLDFDQMWGSSTMTPNAANAKMGAAKSEVMPHLFEVGGIRVEGYMSPSDEPETHMIDYIQAAQYSQLFCIFSFTSDPLSLAMHTHRDATPGFDVRGVFDPGQVNSSSEWCKLDGQVSCPDYWTPRADVFQDPLTEHTLLHHKYQILDVGHPGAMVWTGSHNWSAAAKTTNDENIVVVHDATIANLYYQEWYQRYRTAGGQQLLAVPGGTPRRLALGPCQPNPTPGATTIEYSVAAAEARVTLAIYDVSGRRVRTLVDGPVGAGSHLARWDGRDEAGHTQRAGAYFYRLQSGAESASRVLILKP